MRVLLAKFCRCLIECTFSVKDFILLKVVLLRSELNLFGVKLKVNTENIKFLNNNWVQIKIKPINKIPYVSTNSCIIKTTFNKYACCQKVTRNGNFKVVKK